MKQQCCSIPTWLHGREVCPDYVRVWILLGHLDGPDAGTCPYVENALGALERGQVKVAAGEE